MRANSGQGMVLLDVDIITMAGGRGNSNSVALGSANIGDEVAEINSQLRIVDFKGKIKKKIVDVLKAGFDDIAIGDAEFSGSKLTDSIGEAISGRGLSAGGHIEITHIDNIAARGKTLSVRDGGKGKS